MPDVETHNPYAPPTVDVASPASESGLKHRSVWLMLVLLIVTLGFYYPIWFLRRRKALNQLNAPKKVEFVPIALFMAYFVASFVLGLLTGATPAEYFGRGAADVLRAVDLGIGITMILQCFRIKNIVEDHAGVKLSGLMTFFFSIFYLQYAINRYVVAPRPL